MTAWTRGEVKDLRPERATRMIHSLLALPNFLDPRAKEFQRNNEYYAHLNALIVCVAIYTRRVVKDTMVRGMHPDYDGAWGDPLEYHECESILCMIASHLRHFVRVPCRSVHDDPVDGIVINMQGYDRHSSR